MIDLPAIRARAEAATKGPWSLDVDGWNDVLLVSKDREARAADYIFMEHARADIPALIEEVERLRGIVSACEWVPVGVRLPKEGRDVLLMVRHPMNCGRDYVAIGWKDDGQWLLDNDGGTVEATHWMPLPEGPKNTT